MTIGGVRPLYESSMTHCFTCVSSLWEVNPVDLRILTSGLLITYVRVTYSKYSHKWTAVFPRSFIWRSTVHNNFWFEEKMFSNFSRTRKSKGNLRELIEAISRYRQIQNTTIGFREFRVKHHTIISHNFLTSKQLWLGIVAQLKAEWAHSWTAKKWCNRHFLPKTTSTHPHPNFT